MTGIGTIGQLLLLSLAAAGLAACQADECGSGGDCDDGLPCTQERCRYGVCSHLPIPGCCQSDADCGPEAPTCDLESHSCTITGWVLGSHCTADTDCRAGLFCLKEAETGFPGGMCAQSCSTATDCESWACLPWGEGGICLPPCQPDGSCRRSEYICLAIDTAHAACVPHCTAAEHCPTLGQCNTWRGFCGATGPGSANGAPCQTDADCLGYCTTEAASGAPGGVCLSLCSQLAPACPDPAESCVITLSPFLYGASVCLPRTDPALGCREHYAPLVALDLATEQPVAVCQPACAPAGCASGVCNVFSGLCDDDPGAGADTGAPCVTHENCKGLCMGFWTGGYCSSPCLVSAPNCTGDAVCVDLGVQMCCLDGCATDADCRQAEGYTCNPQARVCLPPP